MSHLTVSAVNQSLPGTAPVGSVAAASGSAAQSPFGFLAALVDQLLGPSPARAEAGEAASALPAGPAATGLAGVVAFTPVESASDPLATLAAQLDQFEVSIATGTGLSPADMADLRAALEAAKGTTPASSADPEAMQQIMSLLADLGFVAPPTREAAPAPPSSTLHDRLASLSHSLAATAPELARQLASLASDMKAGDPGSDAVDPDIATIAAALRALLGQPAATPAVNASAEPGAAISAGGTAPPTASVPDALLRVSNQLTALSTALASDRPELAARIETVAARLLSAADGDLFAQLNTAAGSRDGAALDRLVQSLLEGKPASASSAPATTPAQIAAGALFIPAPLASKPAKSAVTELKAAQPEPAPVTAGAGPVREARIAAPDRPAVIQIERNGRDARIASPVAGAASTDAPVPAATPAAQPPGVAAAARILPTAYQPVANPINMGQVAFEMARQAQQGISRFTIRLDPPELGRVDVKMQLDATGGVTARLTVDRPETLDMFQRDQRALERALVQAGLDAGRTSLEFSLRQNQQNPFAGLMGGDQQQRQPHASGGRSVADESGDVAALPAITLYRGIASASGVNLFV